MKSNGFFIGIRRDLVVLNMHLLLLLLPEHADEPLLLLDLLPHPPQLQDQLLLLGHHDQVGHRHRLLPLVRTSLDPSLSQVFRDAGQSGDAHSGDEDEEDAKGGRVAQLRVRVQDQAIGLCHRRGRHVPMPYITVEWNFSLFDGTKFVQYSPITVVPITLNEEAC